MGEGGFALTDVGADVWATEDFFGIESCSVSDLCNLDSFVGSLLEPDLFSLADLSTRVWSCDLNERLNMAAVFVGGEIVGETKE